MEQAQEEKQRRQNDVLNIVHPTVRPSVHRHTETSSWSIDTLETSVLQKKRDFELEAVLSLDVKGVFVDNTDSNAVQREGVKTTPHRLNPLHSFADDSSGYAPRGSGVLHVRFTSVAGAAPGEKEPAVS